MYRPKNQNLEGLRWIDGTPFQHNNADSFETWDEGQPEQLSTSAKQCTSISAQNNFAWTTASCNENLISICEGWYYPELKFGGKFIFDVVKNLSLSKWHEDLHTASVRVTFLLHLSFIFCV